jgi:RND family efflux transporter MFP subunit
MSAAARLCCLLLAALPCAAAAQAQPQAAKPPATLPADTRAPLAPLAPLPAPAEMRRAGSPWDCLLEPHVVVSVGSPVDGVIEAVLAERGDSVRKGQVVARLQSGVEAAAMEVTRARIEFGRRKVARNEELYKKQLISAHEKDEMETEVRLHEQEFKKDMENLKLRTIVSPIDGIVVERRLSRGDLIRADRSVVLKLAQINPLHVEVVAPADLFGTVKNGMTGTVTLAPLLPGAFKAKVVVVDRLIDAASGTFGVRLELPNPGNRIPAGIKCAVQFPK